VCRRLIAEVEADGRRDLLHLAARLHVQLDDQVGVPVQTPGEIFRQERRHLAGRPAEEVAVRIDRRSRNQSAVARSGIRIVETPRRRRRVDADVRVVHDLRVAGPEFQPAHEAHAVHGDRQDEDVKGVGAFRRQRVRLRQGDDEIRFSKLPAVGPWRTAGG
jgi:hypothetical protein